ncbi:hypothetical protein [Streptomyces sp. NPDC006668]|uniref:hypothetical protein n=1 Tax=Streptomyces sp. NPDC006668 TaxID=3156903 RepID=UPI0033CE61A2
MTNLAAKGLVVAAIIGGSLFATNGAAFAAGTQPAGAVVVGSGEAGDENGAILNAQLDADAQCQSGLTTGRIDYNTYTTAGGTKWEAWWKTTCK